MAAAMPRLGLFFLFLPMTMAQHVCVSLRGSAVGWMDSAQSRDAMLNVTSENGSFKLYRTQSETAACQAAMEGR